MLKYIYNLTSQIGQITLSILEIVMLILKGHWMVLLQLS